MDKLRCMAAFCKIIERGSFAAAARDLRVSRSAISNYISCLEQELGVALLARTTRRVVATEAGRLYFEQCVSILEGVDEADRIAAAAQGRPSGVLRITAPMSFAIASLNDVIATFMAANPELRLEIVLSDATAELLQEGYDVAVRIAPRLGDSGLVMRRIATLERALLGAPRYVREHGAPASPHDLDEHDLLVFSPSGEWPTWRFVREKISHEVNPKGRLLINNSLALRGPLVAGHGLTLTPVYLFEQEIRDGALVRLMDDYFADPLVIHAVYPPLRFVPLKVRAFVDHLVRSYA